MASPTNLEIEPLTVLPTKRRKTETNCSLCMFCQFPESLSDGSSQGITEVLSAFNERLSFENNDTLTRLLPYMTADCSSKQPKWHKSCYASFTSSNNIRVAQKRHQQTNPSALDKNSPGACTSSRSLTRVAVPKVDWNKCIYCQCRKREKIHQVQSDEVEMAIYTHAKYDASLKCKIGENDLKAYEAHYHSSCKYQAERYGQHVQDDETTAIADRDIPLEKLVDILDDGFQSGHIYSMDLVTEKRDELLSKA
ncbi:hypothetical protein GWK47_002241 [Chionoecetes opilio]|uniref:Uncharacterized protein n=1 Tax=Chionoecetes opilio TaxID=41210 RepID=A0A8J4XR74_CHIOP|nr:hypothetical protein GWK47_002241 [Chionoecetes opilio]